MSSLPLNGDADNFVNMIGHIGDQVSSLTMQKNLAYGDAAGKTGEIMEVLYPDGVPVEGYADMLLMVRVLDKLSRLATGDPTAFSESPWLDIAGYGLLGAAQDEWRNNE